MQKVIFVTLLFLLTPISFAKYNPYRDLPRTHAQKQCGESKQSWRDCLINTYWEFDAELNRTYKVITDELKKEMAKKEGPEELRLAKNAKKELEYLKSAQRLWVKFREAHSTHIYQTFIDGTIRLIIGPHEDSNSTVYRTAELKKHSFIFSTRKLSYLILSGSGYTQ